MVNSESALTNPSKEMVNNPIDNNSKTYAVTGSFHGSIISAKCEGEARSIFHRYYNGESIVGLRILGTLPALAYC